MTVSPSLDNFEMIAEESTAGIYAWGAGQVLKRFMTSEDRQIGRERSKRHKGRLWSRYPGSESE